MATKKELEIFRDAILDLIIAYDFNFGEVCGTFEDIKFSLWNEMDSIDEEDENNSSDS